MLGRMRTVALMGSLTLALGAATGWSEEPRVEVLAEVVHASDSGTAVDPPTLASMRDAFAKSGIQYKSYRRLSRERVTLHKDHRAEVKLPNNVTASLKLKGQTREATQVQVVVPPVDTTYTLGKEGSVFIQAGAYNGGMLILVLSPVQR